MAQLLVRNIPDALVRALKIRAAEHGVSAEEEHRRILAAQLRAGGDTAPYNFKDHISALFEVEEDVSFDRPRSISNRPPPEL
jgi:plasmid stability protein